MTEVDGKPVADGHPGSITGAIRRAYLELLASGRDGMGWDGGRVNCWASPNPKGTRYLVA
ncbi:MAG: hypothetical protein HY326_02740 [Chloroflexi bacterium]|nr:hypothetical protein [Chloroflexota bacterium]